MNHIYPRRRRIREMCAVAAMHLLLFRRWISEIAIVGLMLALLVVEIRLRFTTGAHTIAHITAAALFTGLLVLWLCVNRAALARWEQDAAKESDSRC